MLLIAPQVKAYYLSIYNLYICNYWILTIYDLGDFSFDPLGLGKKDFKKLQVNELKNGRLAMLAFSGIATQAALGHATFPCKLITL